MRFLAVIAVAVLMACSSAQAESLEIVGKDGARHAFKVEIASTAQERRAGLQFRERMAPDHGMLFVMDKAEVELFWMKDTLIPLDMLFIAPDGTIAKIHENAKPGDLTPISSGVPVSAVLEINGGRAAELGIAAGDKVDHPFFKEQKP
jgi:uncharacterized membrane protein (UPF0127 family)